MVRILFVLLFVGTLSGTAQEDAWVYFTNKPNASTYLSNPLQMLSQRALDRRTTQNIALDITDVPIHQPYYNQVKASAGITVMAKSKWMNALHVRGTIANINALQNLSFVSEVKFANTSLGTQTAPLAKTLYRPVNKQLSTTTDFSYGSGSNQIEMLNGHLLHENGYTGTGKIIAVMDAGFPGVNTIDAFTYLYNHNGVLGGYNYPDRSTNFYTRNNHGTMVLSCMAAKKDNQLVGTAPDAQYYLFITEDSNSENPVEESYWVEATEKADSLGVDVINTSLGYFEYDNTSYSYTYNDMNGIKAFMSRGANMAFSKGIICVNSAGNSGQTENPHITVPADALHILSVGMVTPFEDPVSSSSIGPSFDGRVKPEVSAQGAPATVFNDSGNLASVGGTSVASPITAGLVACLWAAYPNHTNAQIMEAIKQSADDYTTPTPQKGYGVPDFWTAYSTLEINQVKAPIQLYPNPVQSYFNINTTYPVTFERYDITGKLLETLYIEPGNTVDATQWKTGIYFYQILSNYHKSSGKLIKL